MDLILCHYREVCFYFTMWRFVAALSSITHQKTHNAHHTYSQMNTVRPHYHFFVPLCPKYFNKLCALGLQKCGHNEVRRPHTGGVSAFLQPWVEYNNIRGLWCPRGETQGENCLSTDFNRRWLRWAYSISFSNSDFLSSGSCWTDSKRTLFRE